MAHDTAIPALNADGLPAGAADGDNTTDNRTNPQPRGAVDPCTQGRQYNRTLASPESVEYKLFRFFDFTIEPGKSYVYRVSLALKNPNFGVDAAKLQKADYAKEKYLYTNPAANAENLAQTGRVDVPKDTQVLVGAAKSDDLAPGKFPVVLLTWVEKNGRAGYYSVPNVDHGQVLNFTNEKPVLVTPDSPTPAPIEEDTKADFVTDATLLDMDGGKKFTLGKAQKTTEPREMLFMMVNGKSVTLMLRGELDDLSEVNRVTTKPETISPVPDRRGTPARGAVDPRTRGAVDPRTLVPGADPGGRR